MLGESEDDRDRRRLVEWIAQRGGSATARDVQMGCRWLRDAGAAEAAWKTWRRGAGQWEPTPHGQRGQPTRHFRLATPSAVNGISVSLGKNSNTVAVDNVDTSESLADAGEWGEVWSTAELLADVARRGIKLEPHGDRLRYCPRSAVTPDLAERLAAHKAELLAMLQTNAPTHREAPEPIPVASSPPAVDSAPRCPRCGFRGSVDVPIHDGQSMRARLRQVQSVP